MRYQLCGIVSFLDQALQLQTFGREYVSQPLPPCQFTDVTPKLLHTPDGRDITTFMHLDRGLEFVDHHCFFIFSGPKSHVHHSSFEVFDFDTQVIGHDWLTKQGYENCWGVGRHILGSQIFDYW